MEWSLSAAQDVIAGATPDRDMLVRGDVRRSYDAVRRRTTGLAAFLSARGLGARRERSALERWECGQSTVGLVMHNRCEYIESMLGCYRARAVPFNVNHHYRPSELRALFDMVEVEAIVYERQLGPRLAEAIEGLEPVLIDVEDASGVPPLPGSTAFEDTVATTEGALAEPSPDDLYMICTGGTTGAPKAVLWRQADIFCAGMGGSDTTTAERLAKTAADGGIGVWYPAPPLMHAAAQWTAFVALYGGGTVVLHDDSQRFDARAILEVLERERVTMISIVGDAYARPIIEELRRTPRELPALQRIGTGGAVTAEGCKAELLELLPHVTIVDGYGASETGGMAYGVKTKTASARGFVPGLGAVVISNDRTRVLEPSDEEVGWTARRGRVPLGYLGDREKTEATFPVIDGERFAVPGDRAALEPDGSIRMLGRDSMVVNTGGEKVFVEEVEGALKPHPAVEDVLVVGRPRERFGQEVVAIVQTRPGVELPSPKELREFAARSIARFKAPRAVAYCERIGRHPTGKPDYQWARNAALSATSVPTSESPGGSNSRTQGE
jgi:acyl-CoA synthetase (AMP-forming)/AMP-acid ligase II